MGDPGSIPELGRCPGEGHGNHSSILPWKIPWTEVPSGLWSMGLLSWTRLNNSHTPTPAQQGATEMQKWQGCTSLTKRAGFRLAPAGVPWGGQAGKQRSEKDIRELTLASSSCSGGRRWGKDIQVLSPPFPRGWENLPGQHLERGNCPPAPTQRVSVCVHTRGGVPVLHASLCPSPRTKCRHSPHCL